MSRKNIKDKSIGRALIKSRFGHRQHRKRDGEDFIHSVDMQDGYDWGQLNLQSVTEESSFQEFLATAELAGTEFQAEKLNIKFVNTKNQIDLLSKEEQDGILKLQEENRDLLKIPRRPKWDKSTTSQELQAKEKEEFLEWRRTLALLQEQKKLLLTPYEKNLEFWRQLWRVIERSHVIVQIVDARNPLLFRCEDLEQYVKEVDPNKLNMILINKADFLTAEQRVIWAEYFNKINVHVAFFSATQASLIEEDLEDSSDVPKKSDCDETEKDDETESETESEDEDETENEHETDENEYESADENEYETANEIEDEDTNENEKENDVSTNTEVKSTENEELVQSINDVSLMHDKINNSSDLLNREELIKLLRTIYPPQNCKNNITTIGLVGYPNVGKSSTINALIMHKKVSVSQTPGKTKHFQTIYLDDDLLLCDCPGLVMPSFVTTKAEMVLNGILPVNQLHDHVSPITLLATWIPRHVIEDRYGIMIPRPGEGDDPDRPPTAEELLNAHGYNRGFMTQNGQPDNARSARYLLKDFICGKLLYCIAPPDYCQNEFHKFAPTERKPRSILHVPPKRTVPKNPIEDLDKKFFQNTAAGVHIRGKNSPLSAAGSEASLNSLEKPWKALNKHGNKKKREKSRRLYAHLDQH